MPHSNIRQDPAQTTAVANGFEDCGFVDEGVVRQMILNGEPDVLPPTGNPCLPQSIVQESVPRPVYPMAFAG